MATLTFKGERLITNWAGNINGTWSSPAAGAAGDLLIFIYMCNGAKTIGLSSGWTWVDSPANKSSSSTVSFAYKQLTETNLSTSISISNGSGGATLVHLGPCTIVRTGVYTASNPVVLNEPGDNFVLQSNPGDTNDGWLTSNGFSYLPPTARHYPNGYQVLWKAFKDSIAYHVNTRSDGSLIYNNTSWGERPSYMILRLGPVPELDVEVASSDDGIVFSSFTAFNPSAIPQKRFLKFRAGFSGGVTEGDVSTFEFDQSKPETKVALNEFLESVSTNVKFKTLYSQSMIRDVSHVDGKLFTATVDKTKFKKITKLEVK
jgi:hypothetical protein